VLNLSEEVLMNVVQVLDGVDGQVKFHQLRHVNVIRKSKLKKIQNYFFDLSLKLELYVVLTLCSILNMLQIWMTFGTVVFLSLDVDSFPNTTC
jgi:hypothetical protein